MKKIALLILFCIGLFSCSNDDVDCSLVQPPPSNMLLKLEDTDGNSLIGTTFVQDSFKLHNTSSTIYLKPYATGPQDELVFWFDEINSNATYYLELSPTDTDTLSVGHTTINDVCFSYKVLNSFIYNTEIIYDDNSEVNSNYFVIVKE